MTFQAKCFNEHEYFNYDKSDNSNLVFVGEFSLKCHPVYLVSIQYFLIPFSFVLEIFDTFRLRLRFHLVFLFFSPIFRTHYPLDHKYFFYLHVCICTVILHPLYGKWHRMVTAPGMCFFFAIDITICPQRDVICRIVFLVALIGVVAITNEVVHAHMQPTADENIEQIVKRSTDGEVT